MDNYAQKLINSGYKLEQTRKIIISGLKGYEKKLAVSRKKIGGRKLHQGAKDSRSLRYRRKLMSKANWFREKPGGKLEDEKEIECVDSIPTPKSLGRGAERGLKKNVTEHGKLNGGEIRTTACIFVDQTPGGELAGRLRKSGRRLEQVTGFEIKVVEMGGSKLQHLLPNTNPWSGAKCGRDECVTCGQGGEKLPNCFQRNLLYESKCMECDRKTGMEDQEGSDSKGGKGKKKEAVYVGETSRSIYERSKEHWGDWRDGKEDSHILKHWLTEHNGEGKPDFRFKVIRIFKDCLSRQVAESVRIQERGEVLNSKTVYSRCKIPRLTIDREEEDSGRKSVSVLEESRRKRNKMGALTDTFAVGSRKRERREARNAHVYEEREMRPRKRARRNFTLESEDWGEGEETYEETEAGKRRRKFLSEQNSFVEGKSRLVQTRILPVTGLEWEA